MKLRIKNNELKKKKGKKKEALGAKAKHESGSEDGKQCEGSLKPSLTLDSLRGEKDASEKYLAPEEVFNPKKAPIKNLRQQFEELVGSVSSRQSTKKPEMTQNVPISFRDGKQFTVISHQKDDHAGKNDLIRISHSEKGMSHFEEIDSGNGSLKKESASIPARVKENVSADAALIDIGGDYSAINFEEDKDRLLSIKKEERKDLKYIGKFEIDEWENSNYSEKSYLIDILGGGSESKIVNDRGVENPSYVIIGNERDVSEILDAKATYIQKVWRGYITRKVLDYYLALAEQEEEELLNLIEDKKKDEVSVISWGSHKIPNSLEHEVSEVIEDEDKKWVSKNGALKIPGYPAPLINQDSRSVSRVENAQYNDDMNCSLLNTMNSHHSEEKQVHISAIGMDVNESSQLIMHSDNDNEDEDGSVGILREKIRSTPNKGMIKSSEKPGKVVNKMQDSKGESHGNKLPSQNTISYKEINENSKSLITVKDFSESDKDDSKLGGQGSGPSKNLNRKFDRKEKSSTEFLRDQLKDELQDISKLMDKSAQETPREQEKKPSNIATACKSNKSYYYEDDDENELLKHPCESLNFKPEAVSQKITNKSLDNDIRGSSDKKKASALADKMRQELDKMKNEGLNEWSDIINQINTVPEGEGEKEVYKKAYGFFNVLQKQLEFNKRILEENLEIQSQIAIKSESLYSSEEKNENGILLSQHKKEDSLQGNQIDISKHDKKSVETNSEAIKATSNSNSESLSKPVQAESNSISSRYEAVDSQKQSSMNVIEVLENNKSTESVNPYRKQPIKRNLIIETENYPEQKMENILNENQKSISHTEINISGSELGWNQVRLFLLSERIHSNKPLSQSLSTPRSPQIKRHNEDLKEMTEDLLGEDRAGMSIFERKPFQLFTGKKFTEILKNKNIPNLIKIREQVLEFRHKTQVELMNKMMAKEKFSPRTFQNKRDELERWVTREREDIKRTKNEIEKGWLRTADTIIKTQRDITFMQKFMSKDDTKTAPLSLKASFSEEDLRTFRKHPHYCSQEADKFDLEKADAVSRNFSSSSDFLHHRHLFDDRGMPRLPSHFKEKGAESNVQSNIEGDLNVIREEIRSLKDQGSPVCLSASEEFGVEDAKPDAKLISPRDQTSFLKIVVKNQEAAAAEGKQELQQSHNRNFSADNALHYLDSDEESSNTKGNSMPEIRDIQGKSGTSGHCSSVGVNSSYIKHYIDQLSEISEEVDKPQPKNEREGGKQIEYQIPKIVTTSDLVSHFEPTNTNEISKILTAESNYVLKDSTLIIDDIVYAIMEDTVEELCSDPVIATKKIKRALEHHIRVETENQSHISALEYSISNVNIERSAKINYDSLFEKLPYPKIPGIPDREKGFDTSISHVKQFIQAIVDFIKSHYMDALVGRLNKPLGRAASDKLKYIDFYEIKKQVDDPFKQEPRIMPDPILPTKLFSIISDTLKKKDNEEGVLVKRLGLLKVHDRIIFDAFNDCLNNFRVFGKRGSPCPWKIASDKINQKKIRAEDVSSIIDKSREKTILLATNVCGFIPDKEDSPFAMGLPIDEEYLSQIREERMAKMLSKEIQECEEEWVHYEDEETEVELEISNMLMDQLVEELALELLTLSQRRVLE